MKTILSLLFAFLTTTAIAGERVKLLHADVLNDDRHVELFLELDELGDAYEMDVVEFQKGELFKEIVVHGEDVNTGVLLLDVDGHKVLNLVCPNFTPQSGGNVTLDFLRNGISGSRGSVDFDLVREGNKWQLYKNNVKINNIKIKKKKFLGKVVGIKRIEY